MGCCQRDKDIFICFVHFSKGENSGKQMTDLLQVASEVGKAVESLVNIMTDDEQQDDPPSTFS